MVRRRFSRLMIVSVLLFAVASVGLLQVLQTSQIAAVGYDLRALELERQSLEAEIRVMEAQIANSSNLDHVHEQAVTRLGMVPPEEAIRVEVDVSAPASVPLPRRYVVTPPAETRPPVEPTWWEVILGRIPGLE